MRKPLLAAFSTAIAAAALLTGAGVATANAAEPVGSVGSSQQGPEIPQGPPVQGDPIEPADPEIPAECVYIKTAAGLIRCMDLDPAVVGALSSIGYGSLGTGSLADLLTGLVNTGSVVLSVDVPNSTGSYAPGSVGSYGPEAAIGNLALLPIASLAGAS